jgi:hypothetical protein
LVLKARIPADQGELIIKALEMAIEEDYVGGSSAGDTDNEPEPIAARRADALTQVVVHVGAASAANEAEDYSPHLDNGPDVTTCTKSKRWWLPLPGVHEP